MQVKHLYLKQYKNLNEFRVDFNKPISVIIGRNGSGKSNILEAITEIFRNLFYTESLPLPFPYTIEYEIGISKIFISTLDGTYKIKIDGKDVELTEIQKISKTWVYKKIPEKLEGILPDNILLYYSGQSTRIDYHFSTIQFLLQLFYGQFQSVRDLQICQKDGRRWRMSPRRSRYGTGCFTWNTV